MKTKFIVVMILVVLAVGACHRVYSEELPYGAFLDDTFANGLTQNGLDSLKNLLGFNLLYTCSYDGNVSLSRQDSLAGQGFEIISYMNDPDDDSLTIAFKRYLNAHYLLTQAEDTDLQIRFLVRNGHVGQDTNWFVAPKSDTSFYFLDDLYYRHEVGFGWRAEFEPFLRMRLWCEAGVQDADTVATLVIWKTDNKPWEGHDHRHESIFKTYGITAGDLPGDTARTLDLANFTLPGDMLSGMALTYQLNALRLTSISSTCSLAVDWLKVYNQEGKRIVEDTTENAIFRNHILSNPPATFFQLRDDMHTDMMMPARRLDSLITTYSDKGSMMKFYEGFISSPTDMLKIARPKRFWIDRYPLYGGGGWDTCATGPTTYYSGYENDPDNGLYGLQYRIDEEITSRVAALKAACGDSVDLWYTPQAQSARANGCELYWNRPPTASELSMQVWMGLCYGAAGVQFWPYAFYQGTVHEYVGLVDMSGNPTPSWIYLKERVTPYLKAIDSVYMGLNWQRAYAYHEGTPSRTPAAGAFISSISAISNTSDPNPDSGWFHVGEFTDASGDPYVMFLNRACSQGEWDPTEAPSITATVKFNSNLGNDSSFYVIDLATGTDSADWVGTPETTYTAIMSDGTIPYTITLRAGEGRLLKIISAPRELQGTLNTNLTYQGTFTVTGDITAPAGGTIKIISPAAFEFDEGTKLTVNGIIKAKGTYSDSIRFIASDTSNGWHGLHFNSAGAACSLQYCIVEYGKANSAGEGSKGGGIYLASSNINIDHCSLRNNMANTQGGGLYSASSSPIVTNSSVASNVAASHGGGLYFYYGNPTLTGNYISYDSTTYTSGASSGGGGVYFYYCTGATVTGNTINSNFAGYSGGGISCYGGNNYFFRDNDISDNVANNYAGGIRLSVTGNTIARKNTIVNNKAIWSDGGAIYQAYANSHQTTIDSNTVQYNYAAQSGGGIASFVNTNDTVAIEYNIIEGDTCKLTGAGIYCYNGSARIRRNLIDNNVNDPDYEGGLLGMRGDSLNGGDAGGVDNPIILDDSSSYGGGEGPLGFGPSGYGGGVYCHLATPVLDFNTIADNVAAEEGGGLACGSNMVTVKNTIVWGNSSPEVSGSGSSPTITYSDVEGGYSGTGNINADPKFDAVSATGYGLSLKCGAKSPCLDIGDPASSNDPDGTRADMGAYFMNHTNLSDTISGTLSASGSPYLMLSSCYIEYDSTLVIEPGCKILFDGDYALQIDYGTALKAIGTESDSIFFLPIDSTTATGGWAGIIDSDEAYDTLAYCVIKYAEYGYDAIEHSHAILRHSEISDNLIGINLSQAGLEETTIDTCLFTSNWYAILANFSYFLARGNTIILNDSYGIGIICQTPADTNLQSVIEGNIITSEGSNSTGIRIVGNGCYHPSAILKYNVIKHCAPGIDANYAKAGSLTTGEGLQLAGGNIIDSSADYGISLYYSSPGIFADTDYCTNANRITHSGLMGIHCDNSSPLIKETYIGYNPTNIGCRFSSQPNLGDSINFYGGNVLDHSTSYDIDIDPPLLIKAKGNYWGENPPDTLDFYPSQAWVDYFPYSFTPPNCDITLAPRLADAGIVPKVIVLHQNYPNPFNPSTNISFDLPQDSWVRLSIYNLLGQRVKIATDRQLKAGTHIVRWDGRNESGREVASGMYFYLLEAGSFRETKKMLMLR